jgi:glycosyltransferase involved in cell wall biosynthesis
VIIPAHNKGTTIRASIESVLRQTITDVEIIVVDDGSVDDTAERLRSPIPGVRYLRQEPSGVSAARNRGVREARAPYVAFLDGDDLWLPDKLERQLAVLEREPGIDAVQCSVYLVSNRLEVIDARRCDPAQDTLEDFLFFRNLPGFGSTLLARKSRIETLGGFGEDLVILEDWDLACRLARTGSLRSLPDFLALYRQHAGNRSRVVKIHVEPGFRSLGRLFADPALDAAIRRQEARIWARFYSMLAGGYLQHGQWREGLRWMGKALGTSPWVAPYFAALPARRLQRWLTRQERRSFGDQFSFAVLPGVS